MVSWWPNAEQKASHCSYKSCYHSAVITKAVITLCKLCCLYSFSPPSGCRFTVCLPPSPVCVWMLPPASGNLLSLWLQNFAYRFPEPTPYLLQVCRFTTLQQKVSVLQGLITEDAKLKVKLTGCFAKMPWMLRLLTPGCFQESCF